MTYCDVCNQELAEEEGFLLRTEEVITSEPYWNKAFRMLPIKSAEAKFQYVKLMVSQTKPWIVCSKCIRLFSVDVQESRQNAVRFHLSGGTFSPRSSGGTFSVYVKDEDLDGTDLPTIKICKVCGNRIMPAEETKACICPHCGHVEWIKLLGMLLLFLTGLFGWYEGLMYAWDTPWWFKAIIVGFGITAFAGLVATAVSIVSGLKSYMQLKK